MIILGGWGAGGGYLSVECGWDWIERDIYLHSECYGHGQNTLTMAV